MTVADLKDALNLLPDDMQVILQKDAEGNGYSPLSGADINSFYVPESDYAGEVFNADWTADDHGMEAVSYTHLRAHETVLDLVCRLLLEKKKTK